MRYAVLLVGILLAAMMLRAEDGPPAEAWTRRVDAMLDRMLRDRGVAEVATSSLRVEPARAASPEERVLKAHGLPVDLIAVAKVESALDPQARSPKGALGMWQLMPATARQFGLAEADRTDPVRSTVAAARLLRYLYSRFDDWRLALAAYNAGEGAVDRAIRRARSRDFAEIARRRLLPEETLEYVPKVSALRLSEPATANPSTAKAFPERTIVWAKPQ
ncbi:MAG: lytic transglycosylase domain-containing protein [Bryobacterales bacterium]|nr:lytic transglycosylase domain-containing protein [Bryobacterales bacterium]